MIPGSNLLQLAGTVIGFQKGRHWRNKALVEGGDGINTPEYFPPGDIFGSEQAIPRTAYLANGLDLQKDYVMFYSSTRMQDTRRDKAPDLVDFGGSRYTVVSNTDWQSQDGWQGSICVRDGPTPPGTP